MRTLARSHDIRAIWPQSAEHSRIAARDAARAGVQLVIAMGGDGIVHHVAQGLVDTEAVLGIIPAGTTNVLGRLVGLPARPKDAVKLLAEGYSVKRFPTVHVQADGHEDSWSARVLFSLGVGPDAVIVAAAETEPYRKYRFGSIHYARTALGIVWRDLRKRKPEMTMITTSERAGIGAMVQLHAAYTYFGRVPLRLDAHSPDPLSVLTIERLPMRRAGSIVRRAATGSLERVKGLHLDRQVEAFRVRAETGVEVQIDGEHYGLVTRLTAVAHPDHLAIAVPE